MRCIECSFAQRGGKECRSCVTRGQYMSYENRPVCCEGCEYLTEKWKCTLFRIENNGIKYSDGKEKR